MEKSFLRYLILAKGRVGSYVTIKTLTEEVDERCGTENVVNRWEGVGLRLELPTCPIIDHKRHKNVLHNLKTDC